MWLFTTVGFFSAVQDKTRTDQIWIRARVRSDLENLKKKYHDVIMTDVIDDMGTDYAYRVTLWRDEFTKLLLSLVEDITYTNFKNEVAKECGYERADVYHDVWERMLMLQYKRT